MNNTIEIELPKGTEIIVKFNDNERTLRMPREEWDKIVQQVSTPEPADELRWWANNTRNVLPRTCLAAFERTNVDLDALRRIIRSYIESHGGRVNVRVSKEYPYAVVRCTVVPRGWVADIPNSIGVYRFACFQTSKQREDALRVIGSERLDRITE